MDVVVDERLQGRWMELADHEVSDIWNGIIPESTSQLYRAYERSRYVGKQSAILAIDLYELVYKGGPEELALVTPTYPSSCGRYAWDAIEPTKELFDAARSKELPIIFTTGDPQAGGKSSATERQAGRGGDEDFAIRSEFLAADDMVIVKERASSFFGTPLISRLRQLGIENLIVVGESTSGCVRASTVDSYSYGFHTVVVPECCFDRSPVSHAVTLFDLHHKYADVMRLEEVLENL